MSELSMFLFARPSFIEGVGRLVDFGDTLTDYNYSRNGQEADMLAAWADWTTIGNDFRIAMYDELKTSRDRLHVEGFPKAKSPS